MKLENKIALITGGAKGIGRSIALKLAEEGANVLIADVEDAIKTVDEIKANGRMSGCYKLNVTNSAEVDKIIEQIIGEHGKIDVLVNNAGITRDNLFLRMKEYEWDQVIAVNLKGVFNCTKAVLKYMIKERSGKIVNISSVVGRVGNVGQANYSASKAGVIGFTKTIAREVASRGINVNAIAPGFIDTDMTKKLPEKAKEQVLAGIPFKKMGEVEDVANLVCFLVTDEAKYITGQVINVDGGLAM